MDSVAIECLRLYAYPGSHVDNVQAYALTAADEHQCEVRVDFNGVDIIAKPGQAIGDVRVDYARRSDQEAKVHRNERDELRLDALVAAVIRTTSKEKWTHGRLREALHAVLAEYPIF